MDEYFYELRYRHDLREWRAVNRRMMLHGVWDQYGAKLNAPNPRILDVGCGTGLTALSFADFGSVWGIDSSPLALKFCRERGLHNVTEAYVENLPFEKDSFSLITAVDVLEHVEQDEAALAEIHRVCTPSGLLIIVVPAFEFLWSNRDERLQHRRRYTAAQLRSKVERSGFAVDKCSYVDTYLFLPLLALVKLKLLSGPRPALRMDVAPSLPMLDKIWLALGSLERLLLRRLNFPFGISVLCVARK